MKYYARFLKLGCFTYSEALSIVGNKETTNSLLQQYLKKGYIVNVRRGLYAAVNLATDAPEPNKYLIGSKITPSAVVSHHSAFEFHGVANQVTHDLTVSSDVKFTPFTFDGIDYHGIKNSIQDGVLSFSDGTRVTDIERTVIDSINDIDKAIDFEELIQCISIIPALSEAKLLDYLAKYNKCFLYQKTGFILEHFAEDFALSEHFFQICKEKAGQSSRYLLHGIRKPHMAFSSRWHLTIPDNLYYIWGDYQYEEGY